MYSDRVAGTVVVVDGTVVKVIGAVLADICTELVGTWTCTWNVFLITAALMQWRRLNLCFRGHVLGILGSFFPG